MSGNDDRICERALKVYGEGSQTLMLAEECAELVKACTKLCRARRESPDGALPVGLKDNLTEEIADVRIMVRQMMLLWGVKEADVERVMEEKLQRLRRRMEDIG